MDVKSDVCATYCLSLCQEGTTQNDIPLPQLGNNNQQEQAVETSLAQPLIPQEKQLVQVMLQKHLEPLFLPTTMGICQYHLGKKIFRENEGHLSHLARKRKGHDMSGLVEDTIAKSNESELSKVVLTLMRKEHTDLKKGLSTAIKAFQNASSHPKNYQGGHGLPTKARPGHHGNRNNGNNNGSKDRRQNQNGRYQQHNHQHRGGGRGLSRGRQGRGRGRGGQRSGGRNGYRY